MKINVPYVDLTEDRKASNVSFQFDEVGPGTFKAVVPVVFRDPTKPTEGAYLRSSYPVTINAEATDAQKGKRRILLKASMPYRRAVLPSSGATAPVIGSDAGEISVHTVISVPKALIQDLTVPNAENTDARFVASASLSMLIQLEKSLSMFLGGLAPACTIYSAGGMTDPVSGQRIVPLVEGDTVPDLGSNTVGVWNACRILPDTFRVQADQITGQPTLAVPFGAYDRGTTGGGQVNRRSIGDVLCDPIVRGLVGLRPIEENTEVQLNSAYVPYSDDE